LVSDYILGLFIQQAQRMHRIILSSVARLALQYFSTLSRKRHVSRWRNEHKICVFFISFATWFETFLFIRRKKRKTVV